MSSRSNSDGVIYVDLFHDNLDYLFYSLYIGRLIGRLSERKVIGLTGGIGVVSTSAPGWSFAGIEELARGFDIDIIRFEEKAHGGAAVGWLHGEASSRGWDIETLQGAPLRRLVREGQLADGFPIGRYFYDTYLRAELFETVESLDPALIRHIAATIAFDEAVREQFAKAPPAWLVSGHIEYAPWGVCVHRALENGAKVAYFRNEGRLRIHLLSGKVKAEETLHGLLRRQQGELVNRFIDDLCQNGQHLVQQHFQACATSQRFRTHWFVHAPYCDLTWDKADRMGRMARRQLGILDDRRCIGVFQVTFSDIASHDRRAFDDNYQWLLKTLNFAVEHPEFTWLVKIHPADAIYNRTGAMARLREAFSGYNHIRFVEANVSPILVIMASHVVTTMRGSPGYQAALVGRPAVFAGRGQYSDFGFAEIEESEAPYFDRLIERASGWHIDPAKAMRARAFQYLEDVVLANNSSMLGAFGDLRGAGETIWDMLSRRLIWYDVETDPLYIALEESIRADAPRVGGVPPALRVAVPAVHTALTSSRAFVFRGAWPSDVIALFGFHLMESWGVWTNGEPCTLLLRCEASIRGPLRVTLDLAEHIPGGWERPLIVALRVGGDDVTAAAVWQGHQLVVEVEDCTQDEGGFLIIEMETQGGTVPAELGNSTDSRYLVFTLTGILIEFLPVARCS